MTGQGAQDGRQSDHEVAPGLSAFRMTRAELAAAGKPGNWLDNHYPSLSVMIINTTLCMKLRIVLNEHPKGARRTTHTVLLEADWQPSEVTPRRLVEWAYGGLVKVMTDGMGLFE